MKSIKIIITLSLLSLVVFSCKKNKNDQAAIDKGIIQKYLRDSSLVADSTESGLYYIISDSGDVSRKPTSTSAVTVYYKGYFVSGIVFDENRPGLPEELSLLKVIKGWQEGIPLIGKGGQIKLLIPSALGYGTTAYGAIPANSVLIFDIKLDSFR